jgi:hypothetical protein
VGELGNRSFGISAFVIPARPIFVMAMTNEIAGNLSHIVIPAKAGIPLHFLEGPKLDPDFRRGDDERETPSFRQDDDSCEIAGSSPAMTIEIAGNLSPIVIPAKAGIQLQSGRLLTA